MEHSISEVAMKFRPSRTTISRVYREYQESGKTSNLRHHCRRKNTMQKQDNGRLTRIIKRDRRATLPQITADFNAGLSTSTVGRHQCFEKQPKETKNELKEKLEKGQHEMQRNQEELSDTKYDKYYPFIFFCKITVPNVVGYLKERIEKGRKEIKKGQEDLKNSLEHTEKIDTVEEKIKCGKENNNENGRKSRNS
ncbi:HTH_Tnp_Tc3_2 domain-containing protein [Trichonephila clavipes]|nr:HTH_Tnp_Tc3_2 domain-containing protein [Trichonephila clavipes]